MTFFNTISATGQTLINFREKTAGQNELIFEVFNTYVRPLTPFEVFKILQSKGFNYPITSVRRGINTLTNLGKLKKTNNKRIGGYGAENFTWELSV